MKEREMDGGMGRHLEREKSGTHFIFFELWRIKNGIEWVMVKMDPI